MTTILITFFSALALPVLAVIAILLRKELISGKAKLLMLGVGILLLSYAVVADILHHGEEFGPRELIICRLLATP